MKEVDELDFPGKVSYKIIICMQFHLQTLGFPWKMINDDSFRSVKYTLDNLIKMRTMQEIDMSVCKAEVILTVTDEDRIWLLGYFGSSNPMQLLNAVIFTIGKGFEIHESCKW